MAQVGTEYKESHPQRRGEMAGLKLTGPCVCVCVCSNALLEWTCIPGLGPGMTGPVTPAALVSAYLGIRADSRDLTEVRRIAEDQRPVVAFCPLCTCIKLSAFSWAEG